MKSFKKNIVKFGKMLAVLSKKNLIVNLHIIKNIWNLNKMSIQKKAFNVFVHE